MSSHHFSSLPEFAQEPSFNEPIANITDVTLVVEDQKMYACKKVLAQHSLYFYDLFYGDDADENKEEYEIEDTTCDSFRLFLRLLYSGNVTINMNNFRSLVELSFRFKADHCLEKCERFLIKQDLTPGLKLRHAQGFNFNVLQNHVMGTFTTFDSVLSLEEDENYEHFGSETKAVMLERMVDLRRGEKSGLIRLRSNKTHVKKVFGISWTITIKRFTDSCFNDFIDVIVECNLRDNMNPWKCRGNISIHCENNVLKSVDHIFCDSKPISLVRHGACDIYDNINEYFIRIQIYPIYGLHEQRLFSFDEICPNLTDVVLSVGDKRFNVSKQILASQSSYFEAMFYSNFVEKGKCEIELKDIDATEFETFLQQIYQSNKVITTDTIEGLLKLSQMYDAQIVLRKCEAFLKKERSIDGVMKLKLAENYNFKSLLEQVVATVKTSVDFAKISQLEGFQELKDETIGKMAKVAFI